MYVQIGGIEQWVQAGDGASRTFRRNGPEGCGQLTLDLMVRDGLEVVEYVLRTLQPASGRVLLVGHSWGSALGVHMLKRRPELFAAFVGAAQLVNMRENEDYNYRWALRRAELLGNTAALEALRELGPPPFSELKTLRELSDQLAEGNGDPLVPSPSARPADFGRDDVPPMMAGAEFSSRQFVRFEGCHHFVVMNRPDDFLRELVARVLPRI